MADVLTISVPHLGGIDVGYRVSPGGINTAKPTVVLLNAMCMTSALYNAQFDNKALIDAVNLVAVEPLGHGATRCASEHFTYWDSAVMALQVMDALGVAKAFALGTSQGGWIVTRMALLAPERILGLVIMGTSMDYESAASRDLGSWDPKASLGPLYDSLSSETPTPDFVIDQGFRDIVIQHGFSGVIAAETLPFWDETLRDVYSGDEGRKKLRMALGNLMDRDGLLRRVRDIKCPVHWLQSPADPVFGKDAPAEHIKFFTGTKDVTLTYVEGGGHYLSATNPKEVDAALLKMVKGR